MKHFAAGLCAALISVLLVVPAFAYTDEELLSTFVNVDGFLFRLDDRYSYSWKYIRFESEEPVFIYRNSSTCYLITRSVNAEVERIVLDSSMNEQSRSTVILSQVFWTNPDDPTDEIYTSANHRPVIDGLPGIYDPELLAANTVLGAWNTATVVNGFKDFESIYVPPVPQSDKSITVPIGYAAYLKASGTLTMRCTFPSNSNLVSTGHGWWGETRQTLGSADSLPSDSFQPSGVQIVWARDSALSALGVLGTTKHAYSEHAAMSPWTVIVNPVNKYLALGSDQNTRDSYNGPITVSGTIGEFRLYPLAGSWSPSTGLEDDGSGSEYIDVNIDPETGEPVYTDPEGNVVTPPAPGGSTALPEAVSSTSLVQRIVGILSDLVNRIEGIFSVAYQAISNLVGLAGPFVAKLSVLYSWLPAPVLSALSSAMILAITIGVLKVFL